MRYTVEIIDTDKYEKEEFVESFGRDKKIVAVWDWEKLNIDKISEIIDEEQTKEMEAL